jgi:hypothetical protein
MCVRVAARVDAIDPHHGTDRPGLFDGELGDLAGVLLFAHLPLGGVVGSVFAKHDQVSVARDLATVYGKRFHQACAAAGNATAHRSGADLNAIDFFPDIHGRLLRQDRAGHERERTLETGLGGDGQPGPFDGAIGPKGERPVLRGDRSAIRCPDDDGLALHDATGPGNSPAHSDCGFRRSSVEPGKLHSFFPSGPGPGVRYRRSLRLQSVGREAPKAECRSTQRGVAKESSSAFFVGVILHDFVLRLV